MNTIVCNKGCCFLKIFSKSKTRKLDTYPFEKRKAGVIVICNNKILLTQSYNNIWGIPKGQMEPFDKNTKECAERELKEETGLDILLHDTDLYRVIFGNYYIYKISIQNMDKVNLDNLVNLDASGIGWVDLNCVYDFTLNFITRHLLMTI